MQVILDIGHVADDARIRHAEVHIEPELEVKPIFWVIRSLERGGCMNTNLTMLDRSGMMTIARSGMCGYMLISGIEP